MNKTGPKNKNGILCFLMGFITALIPLFAVLVFYWLHRADTALGYMLWAAGGILVLICATAFFCVRYYMKVEVENRVYREIAFRDSLTRLPNRAALDKRITELTETKRVFKSVTVVLMDVNGLKTVNDRYGHDAGDKLLKKTAACIKMAFPEERGSCFRLGGDEFVAILTRVELSNSECQDRLDKATETVMDGESSGVSISCGCCTRRNIRVTQEAVSRLTQEADQRMYRNKELYYLEKKKSSAV